MGYQYKSICYETETKFLEAYAQDCPINVGGTSTAAYYSFCSVNGTGIKIKTFLWSNNTEISRTVDHTFIPQSSSCDYTTTSSSTFTNADIIELSWLVVGVWVVAWGFKKMMEVLRK